MKKSVFQIWALSSMLAAAMAVPSFAATISEITFDAYIDSEAEISEGVTDPEFITSTNGVDLTWLASGESASGRVARTYELEFALDTGDTFPSDVKNISINGRGIESITSKKLSSDKTLLTLKVKAFPFFKWSDPSFTSGEGELSDGTTKKIYFEKNGGKQIEYCILWVNQDSNEKRVHGTTTNSYVSISSYNKPYKGTKDDKSDSYVEGIAIRAAGPAGSNKGTAPSEWVTLGDIDVYDFRVEDYETWGDVIDKTAAKAASVPESDAAAASAPPVATPAQAPAGGWEGSGNDWYYKNADGTNRTGWLPDGANWYYLDAANNGRMKTGWFRDTDGNWYYLNEQHDGTYGRMLTGWQNIGGVWYFLRDGSGGPLGSMVAGTMVMIGGERYTFDASGACLSR